MRFRQIDKILEIEPGRKIRAQRTLRPGEEFLKDHFPKFPVMPGVLMLESLYQAAFWLVRVSDEFRSPLVLLREAKGVKFADFLTPGDVLDIEVEILKEEGSLLSLKAQGRKGERSCVNARLTIEKGPFPRPPSASSAQELNQYVRHQFEEMFGPLTELLPPTVVN